MATAILNHYPYSTRRMALTIDFATDCIYWTNNHHTYILSWQRIYRLVISRGDGVQRPYPFPIHTSFGGLKAFAQTKVSSTGTELRILCRFYRSRSVRQSFFLFTKAVTAALAFQPPVACECFLLHLILPFVLLPVPSALIIVSSQPFLRWLIRNCLVPFLVISFNASAWAISNKTSNISLNASRGERAPAPYNCLAMSRTHRDLTIS